MTASHEQAIQDARAILNREFDSFLITTRAVPENGRSEINNDWHGEISSVVGMAHLAVRRVEKVADDGIEFQERAD